MTNKKETSVIFLVGLKKELLFKREVEYDEAKNFASQHSFGFIELSAFDDD